ILGCQRAQKRNRAVTENQTKQMTAQRQRQIPPPRWLACQEPTTADNISIGDCSASDCCERGKECCNEAATREGGQCRVLPVVQQGCGNEEKQKADCEEQFSRACDLRRKAEQASQRKPTGEI